MKAGQLVLLFAILHSGVAFLTNAQTFTHEEAMWHYIGRNWLRHGLEPYAGGIDNKSPLIFGVFGLSDILFGLNYWFPRVLGLMIQLLGLYFIYKIAKRLYAGSHFVSANAEKEGQQAAVIATTIYGLSLMWRASGGKYVSFTETYATTFVIIAVYQYLIAKNNRRYFLSGCLAGLALAWRLSAGFGVAAVLTYSLVKKRNAVLPFIAGLSATILALLVLARLAGISLDDLWQYAFTQNFEAGSTTDHSFAWKLRSFVQGFFNIEMIAFYPVVLIHFLFSKRYALLTIWLIAEFIGINVPGIYARPHFKGLLPVLSLMGGISLVQLMDKYNISLRTMLVAVWILFFPKINEPWIALKRMVTGKTREEINYCESPEIRPDEQAEKQAGIWIRNNTNAGEQVFVAGFGARVQLYSERLSPTAYFNVTQTKVAKLQTKMDVYLKKPEVIAVPVFDDYRKYVSEELRVFIETIVAKDYVKHDCVNGYVIYRRK